MTNEEEFLAKKIYAIVLISLSFILGMSVTFWQHSISAGISATIAAILYCEK